MSLVNKPNDPNEQPHNPFMVILGRRGKSCNTLDILSDSFLLRQEKVDLNH